MTSLGIGHLYQRLFVGPNIHDNGIIGSKIETYSANNYYPYALPINDTINLSDNFQTAFFQKMACRSFGSFGPSNDGGNWYPEMLDNYLGVRFIDEMECYHFGWIRCDVKDEGRTLVIKDYAYETKCDVGIAAGDTIGDTTVPINEINTLDAVVYTFNKILYVKSEEYSGSKLVINNLQGQKLLERDLKENLTIIDLAVFPIGNYVVTIINPQGVLVKEVNIP